MQIVIPMSGTGSRFIAAGYQTIKPLISVDGKPIIQHIIEKFPNETNFVFICNQVHLETTHLRAVLTGLVPTGKIIGIPPHKQGPGWAFLQAQQSIQDNEPTIINYCDYNWVWDYANFKHTMKTKNYAGAVICYKGFHPHLLGPNFYAGCKVDAQQNLLEIREKYSFTRNKMDSYQSSGTYYFESGAVAKQYLQQQVEENIQLNGEYYISLVYNLLIRDHLPVGVYEIPKFCQWGTPEDLAEFNYWLEIFKSR